MHFEKNRQENAFNYFVKYGLLVDFCYECGCISNEVSNELLVYMKTTIFYICNVAATAIILATNEIYSGMSTSCTVQFYMIYFYFTVFQSNVFSPFV